MMEDFSAQFIGGSMDGQLRSPISESELTNLGYRIAIRGRPHARELPVNIVVPSSLSFEDAHKLILAKLGRGIR